jgi:predicted dehydrogenase
MPEPIRLALDGAGVFARDDHVPAVRALGDRFDIVAVYSRTRATAEALQSHLAHPADIYTDLDEMLARSDIEAVDVVLPIDPQPAAVERALAAGKHVLSEKPISPTVAVGRRLLQLARDYPNQVLLVGENLRYEAAFGRAAELIQNGAIGKPVLASWVAYASMTPDNKFYHTPWRRAGDFPGGFIMDGGVHNIAAFRRVLGEITHVSAEVKLMRADLPPADTLVAAFQFEGGFIGNFTITYAAASPFREKFTVVGDKGALRVGWGELEISSGGDTRTEQVSGVNTMQAEFAAFADAIRSGVPSPAGSPFEALRDVAVIEAILRSADLGCRVEVDLCRDLETK